MPHRVESFAETLFFNAFIEWGQRQSSNAVQGFSTYLVDKIEVRHLAGNKPVHLVFCITRRLRSGAAAVIGAVTSVG